MGIKLSTKQKEFIRKANARWNLKFGAVRSGKSYGDIAFDIIYEIRSRAGLEGLNVIIGVSKSTIERNVLKPMREIYTEALVGTINSNNIAIIAGEEVYCLGGEKISQVAKIQGSSIKYCYGDEIAKWNKEVFEMLKSRLDKEYSRFDGACNPEDPNHWLKKFIDDDTLDKYVQHYTIFDNPFLPKAFVDNLCKEYAGTVYYDRYILGEWKRAEGLCYPSIANGKNELVLSKVPQIQFITCGVDFGGNKSRHTFTATGYGPNLQYIVVLEAKKIEAAGVDPQELNDKFEEFIKMVKSKYSFNGVEVRCDSAEQTLINGFVNLSKRKVLGAIIKNAIKSRINDRITLITRLVAQHRLYWMEWAMVSYNAMATCLWNSKEGHTDERLDDGTTDIDSVDSTEYTIEPYADKLLKIMEYGQGRRL